MAPWRRKAAEVLTILAVLIGLATLLALALRRTLTLLAAEEQIREGVGHPAALGPGHYVRLSMIDDGEGMSTATLARVTEPFFTTKPFGKGTGLGLSMAKGFAEQSGGQLLIESRLGKGSTATIWRPVAGSADVNACVDAVGGPPAGRVGGRKRSVLVVDDDDFVREALAEELADHYGVLMASDAEQAMALLSAGNAVDVLVTDFSMPGDNGLTLIRQARARRPGLPAVLLTGYADDSAPLMLQPGIRDDFSLMRKPVTLGELSNRITALLTQAEAA